MRVKKESDGLSVHAVAGTHVVILAMDLKKEDCDGLLGFAIHRTDHEAEEAYWLQGMRTFAETDPGIAQRVKFSSREHPFQDFTWSDYTAKEGQKYTYRVVAMKGTPTDLKPFAEVKVSVTTESQLNSDHGIFFNRGAAASQEYSRRFGNREPGTMGDDKDPAWAWLSRGAHEAMLAFIARAESSDWGIRVCAYEFRLQSVANALHDAKKRGADVMVLYDGSKPFPTDENREVVNAAGIVGACYERVPSPMAIPHNKFIVLTNNGKPVAVLTGSTNFSTGGVYGQSNVVHIVEDEKVAQQFLDYWDMLVFNPPKSELAPKLTAAHSLSQGLPPKGTTTVLSPRETLDALEYYFKLAGEAKDALFMTFPFGMHNGFKEVYKNGTSKLRYAMMDKLLGPGIPRPRGKNESEAAAEKRQAQEKKDAIDEMTSIRQMTGNRIAVGSLLPQNSFDRWAQENLTGLNQHVQFIHTKYMLIDPLGNDPVVVTGSANFSAASTTNNDENMLLIRGDKRVADIYLGEYMRLWDHYAFRDWATRRAKEKKDVKDKTPIEEERWHLATDDSWWKRYYGDSSLSRLREYFSG